MVQTNKLTLCYELVNNENMGYIDNQLNKNDLPNIGTILKATTTLDSLQMQTYLVRSIQLSATGYARYIYSNFHRIHKNNALMGC